MSDRYRHQAITLARFVLQSYTLSRLEREDEAERLAQAIQDAIEAQVENLEHRRSTRK
jgi:hypothetical protein